VKKKKQHNNLRGKQEVVAANQKTKELEQDGEPIDEGVEINRLLDQGYSVKQIVALGFKRRTAYHYARLRMQPENEPAASEPGDDSSAGTAGRGKQELIKLGARDVIPPEAVLEVLHLPRDGEAVEVWRMGVLDGVGMLLLGARYAQLTAAGQADIVKNQLDIMREAKESNKDIAMEAARLASDQMGQAAMQGNQQILAALTNLATSQGKPSEPDLWQQMAVRLSEPMLAQVMQMLSASLFKAIPQPGMAQQPPSAPQTAAQSGQTGPTQPGHRDAYGTLPENITTHSMSDLEEAR